MGAIISPMTEIITQLTLILLVLAAFIFVLQLVRQNRAGQPSAWSFSSFFLIILIGWMSTEVVSDSIGMNRPDWLRVTHFGVMVLVAATMTLQLRRSFEKMKVASNVGKRVDA